MSNHFISCANRRLSASLMPGKFDDWEQQRNRRCQKPCKITFHDARKSFRINYIKFLEPSAGREFNSRPRLHLLRNELDSSDPAANPCNLLISGNTSKNLHAGQSAIIEEALQSGHSVGLVGCSARDWILKSNEQSQAEEKPIAITGMRPFAGSTSTARRLVRM
jgi:hypothetical protein